MPENVQFYNMVVHLIQNNRLYEENAAVKNVWIKDGDIFFDLYFYRNRRSYVFDAAFIHDLLDLTTEKYYKSPLVFLKDFQDSNQGGMPRPEVDEALIDKKLFEPLQADLVLMVFMAGCCGNYTPVKERIICDYITDHIASTRSFSHQYLTAHLQSLNPSCGGFYKALEALKQKHPEQVSQLVKELVKIALADGCLHYQEKFYLAEILQLLREQGVEIDIGV